MQFTIFFSESPFLVSNKSTRFILQKERMWNKPKENKTIDKFYIT